MHNYEIRQLQDEIRRLEQRVAHLEHLVRLGQRVRESDRNG